MTILNIIIFIIFLILLMSFTNTLIRIDTQIKNEFNNKLSDIIHDLNLVYKDKYDMDLIQQNYLHNHQDNVDKVKIDYLKRDEEIITPYMEANVIKTEKLVSDKVFPSSS